MTFPPTVTTTRDGFASIEMEWSGPGIFIGLSAMICILLNWKRYLGIQKPRQQRTTRDGSRSDLSLRQRRNDGSDSRQLSIQSRLQLLEGGLDFRWRLAIALIDQQSDYVIDFVRNGACYHFDLL